MSLLELIAGAALMAFALVPALEIMRDGMAWSRALDTREMLLNYGVSKLEEQVGVVAASWSTGTLTGDFAGDGHAEIRFVVDRSDDPADGGITDRLMNIDVTTYHDVDGDDALGVNEPQLVMTTKIGKFVTYGFEATL